MNPFESGARKVVPATLIYLFCEENILMIHRVKKNKDIHEGKYNGIGGKLEIDEAPTEAAVREIEEDRHQARRIGAFTYGNAHVSVV